MSVCHISPIQSAVLRRCGVDRPSSPPDGGVWRLGLSGSWTLLLNILHNTNMRIGLGRNEYINFNPRLVVTVIIFQFFYTSSSGQQFPTATVSHSILGGWRSQYSTSCSPARWSSVSSGVTSFTARCWPLSQGTAPSWLRLRSVKLERRHEKPDNSYRLLRRGKHYNFLRKWKFFLSV